MERHWTLNPRNSGSSPDTAAKMGIEMLAARLICVVSLVLVLSGCITSRDRNATLLGAGGGAAAGAVLGGSLKTALMGGLAGGALALLLSQNSNRDSYLAEEAHQYALEYAENNRSMAWRNPNNGHYGATIPTHTFRFQGHDCRAFEIRFNDGGYGTEHAYGTACRIGGIWRIME